MLRKTVLYSVMKAYVTETSCSQVLLIESAYVRKYMLKINLVATGLLADMVTMQGLELHT